MVYVLAPLGVIVKEFPEQIIPSLTVIVGVAFTVTLEVANVLEVQPAALVPITVKVVFAVGFTTLLPPCIV